MKCLVIGKEKVVRGGNDFIMNKNEQFKLNSGDGSPDTDFHKSS